MKKGKQQIKNTYTNVFSSNHHRSKVRAQSYLKVFAGCIGKQQI